ncbi:MAG: acyl-CoA thioesterase [Lewinellaceae bacterium]|nr:acyl-CoA thioesterase [Saprospiraceae bacterium]MCB9337035.1 acyl-CoA thioesterase [Lewinellaceae bacterium]
MHKTLTVRTEVPVRFNEADPLGIVWHGHYIRYFEDGREAFGAQYGLTYLDFYKNGLVVPIVNIDCSYKKPLRYGDKVIVETTYHNLKAAKILFKYKLFHAQNGDLVATGSSVQVFLDHKTNHLHLNNPSFFESWKHKNGLPA